MIKDFFNDVSVEDLIKNYNIRYPRLCGIIKQYCILNNIDFNDEIKDKLELPMSKIFTEKKSGLTYKELGRKYRCSDNDIKRFLQQYCILNNIDFNDEFETKLELPMSKILKEKQSELTYKELGEKYGCSAGVIRSHLKQYCKENNLEYSSKSIDLPMEQVYEEKKKGKTYPELANKYDCSVGTIINYLKQYCEENNLEYPKKSAKLSMKQVYQKFDLFCQELGNQYGCSVSTIKSYLKQYCEENKLENSSNSVKFSVEQIYKERTAGMSYRNLGKKYGCSTSKIRSHLIKYEKEIIRDNQIGLLLDLKEILLNSKKNGLNDIDVIYVKRK